MPPLILTIENTRFYTSLVKYIEALTVTIINNERGAHQAPNNTLTLFLVIHIHEYHKDDIFKLTSSAE